MGRRAEQLVEFAAWRGDELIRLGEVMDALRGSLAGTRWRSSALGGVGPTINELERRLMQKEPAPFDAVSPLLADPLLQVFEGQFVVTAANGTNLLRLRTIGGDEWEVESRDDWVLNSIRAAFADVLIEKRGVSGTDS